VLHRMQPVHTCHKLSCCLLQAVDVWRQVGVWGTEFSSVSACNLSADTNSLQLVLASLVTLYCRLLILLLIQAVHAHVLLLLAGLPQPAD
jgi:hypothetical protein